VPMTTAITVRFAGDLVVLPPELQIEVDRYWNGLSSQNEQLRNGEVFTITSRSESAGGTTITLAETNYAHYLFGRQQGDLGVYAVRVIHPAAMVVTQDNRLVCGVMDSHTSIPGTVQCCGGGIDRGDIVDGVVDIERAIVREAAEELGLNLYDAARVGRLYPAYFKTGGPTGKMTVVYIVELRQTSEELMRDYQRFAAALLSGGDLPEFERLFYVESQGAAVEAFIAEHGHWLDEYMPSLLRACVRS
jgi:8-oxo-dGTP pyrophosphatase MutT (NUDIX family)